MTADGHKPGCPGIVEAHVHYDREAAGYRPVWRCGCGLVTAQIGKVYDKAESAYRAAKTEAVRLAR